MGTYEQLKAAVAAVIHDNGAEEITGDVMQQVLITLINSLGAGATFAGVAVPTTNPSSPDAKMFYLAGKAGTYTNFNLTITKGLWVFENTTGSWVGHDLEVSMLFASGQDVTSTNIAATYAGAGNNDLVTVGAMDEALAGIVGEVALSALDSTRTAGLYRVIGVQSRVVGYLQVNMSLSGTYVIQFLASDISDFDDGYTADYKGHILTRSYNVSAGTWSAWDEYGGGKFASGEKVADVSIAQTLGNSQTSVASQKAVTDAIYNLIDIANIDAMKNDATLRTGGTLARYTATTTLQGVTYKVGILDVMSDSAGHVLTQILTTHYTITSGVLDTSSHSDGAVRQYYRSVKINGGTLPTTDWTLWKPINDEQLDVLSAAVDAVKASVGYYTCDTAAGTAAKVVSAIGYELATGGCIRIKMTNGNTANNVTLNINSTGAKAIYYDGAQASSSNTWEAGEVLEVYYDGTQYQCASDGGGKFATGQKVADVGITPELDNSHNLIESAAVNAVLNESIALSEWIQGSIATATHQYASLTTRIISCAVINNKPIQYSINSGYALSIHEYSAEYVDVHDLSGSTWIKQTTSWLEGNGTHTPDANTKTLVFILAKTPTSSSITILPSESSNLSVNYEETFTLDEMRIMLNLHDKDITALNGCVFDEGPFSITWQNGTLNTNHVIASDSKRLIAVMPAYKATYTVLTGYWCSIHEYSASFNSPSEITNGSSWLGNTQGWFDGTHAHTPLSACKTIVLIMAKGNKNVNITTQEGSNMSAVIVTALNEQVDKNRDDIEAIDYELYGQQGGIVTETVQMEQGGMNSSGQKVNDANYSLRVRTTDFIRANGQFTLNFPANIWYNVFYYYDSSEAAYVKSLMTNAWATEQVLTDSWNGYIRFGCRNSQNTAITPNDVSITLTHNNTIPGLVDRVAALENETDSYSWGVDLIKRNVKTSELGLLTYLQSFCKYNEKYYSTNGTNIAEQDSTFAVLRDVACSVGHGNSLQLVSNGKAWASGWDDQKMYRVDLATLAVDQTITLPTTGYTTCAVDEDNGLMYIFQRQTYPGTEAQYNFIKYDYVNEQVLSTRKIEVFAAMQAVDYWQGKLMMTYGLGTTAAPSGMRIYNTNGDVLATFDLAIFRSKEPEGIMFTRDKGELLVSDADRKLYVVS